MKGRKEGWMDDCVKEKLHVLPGADHQPQRAISQYIPGHLPVQQTEASQVNPNPIVYIVWNLHGKSPPPPTA